MTGAALRRLRRTIPISAPTLAELAGIHQPQLSNWETNGREPSPAVRERVEKTLSRLLALKKLFADLPLDYADVPRIRRMLRAFDEAAAPIQRQGREEARL